MFANPLHKDLMIKMLEKFRLNINFPNLINYAIEADSEEKNSICLLSSSAHGIFLENLPISLKSLKITELIHQVDDDYIIELPYHVENLRIELLNLLSQAIVLPINLKTLVLTLVYIYGDDNIIAYNTKVIATFPQSLTSLTILNLNDKTIDLLEKLFNSKRLVNLKEFRAIKKDSKNKKLMLPETITNFSFINPRPGGSIFISLADSICEFTNSLSYYIENLILADNLTKLNLFRCDLTDSLINLPNSITALHSIYCDFGQNNFNLPLNLNELVYIKRIYFNEPDVYSMIRHLKHLIKLTTNETLGKIEYLPKTLKNFHYISITEKNHEYENNMEAYFNLNHLGEYQNLLETESKEISKAYLIRQYELLKIERTPVKRIDGDDFSYY